MQLRFLLGPSGSGKTFCCMAEARAILTKAPSGPPLVFLAPKQATFQVERQLLADEKLAGYTRLHVTGFEGLADLVLARCGRGTPELLSEEGRLMVLRALLMRYRGELQVFRAASRLRGFAEQLSGALHELQRAAVTAEQLLAMSRSPSTSAPLGAKLHDLAVMLRAYGAWLKEHRVQDRDELLTLAGKALQERRAGRAEGSEPLQIEALWLDGFAELAPGEMEFLAAILPGCGRATLAFNLDRDALGPISWLSPWSVGGQSFRRLEQRLREAGCGKIGVEWLDRRRAETRFGSSPVLKHLEEFWAEPSAFGGSEGAISRSLRVVECPTPEIEAREAAREIRRFVRSGGRFREAAVLVRDLEEYHDVVARVFRSFEIPFFLDRREPVAHHPLVELTRNALRTLAFGWQTEDWFGVLKTGLLNSAQGEIDRLENEALARGWNGAKWREPLKVPENSELEARLEELRRQLVAPLEALAASLTSQPTGRELAAALSSFWERLGVAEQLQVWGLEPVLAGQADVAGLVHGSLWTQMQDWLANVELAFADEPLALREWLPILEAGLGAQTVGVIPPSLDQVLVGAVDRSRNPDLRLTLVLGMNETVFPKVPVDSNLLTGIERDQLVRLGLELSSTRRQQISRERYLGYVACTRSRERLVVTYSLRDLQDKALNASPFIDQLHRLFPSLPVEVASFGGDWTDCEHVCELMQSVFQRPDESFVPGVPSAVQNLPAVNRVRDRLSALEAAITAQELSPVLAEALYGTTLETSVSRLEEYAACPFRFVLTSGFNVEERKKFQVDARVQGSFQHELLARFHQQLRSEGKRWRDLAPAQARARIREIGESLLPHYQNGLLLATEQARFAAQCLIESLQSFVAVAVGWMPQYEFDPHTVELAFGIEEKPLPAWEIDLSGGHRLSFRGKIDRVDLWRVPKKAEALCVVIDYKSSQRRLERVLVEHGIQLQLLAYLNVLSSLPDPLKVFGVEKLIPAGVFFVNLRGDYASAPTRQEVMDRFQAARARAYRHTGRFDLRALGQLDNRGPGWPGDQFNIRFRQDGGLDARCKEALDSAQFRELLEGVERHLRRMGEEIYAGRVKADPYRKRAATACDQCEYQSVCRIDPWTHTYRVLA